MWWNGEGLSHQKLDYNQVTISRLPQDEIKTDEFYSAQTEYLSFNTPRLHTHDPQYHCAHAVAGKV